MIKNGEFKKIRYYKQMIEASERTNFFDQYSIMKAFSRNIVKGKDSIFSKMSFDDEESLQELFEEIEDIEITGDDSFNLGNHNSNIWLKFIVKSDGTFIYNGSKQPHIRNYIYLSGRSYYD